jgi:hypothetical protein
MPFIEYRKILHIDEDREAVCTLYNPVWSGIKNFAWPADYIQMDTHSNTKILDPGFCFSVNSISGLLLYSNMISETIDHFLMYEEVHKYLDIYGYTHKTSVFITSGFKTSGFKTSGFKTSGLQNVRF